MIRWIPWIRNAVAGALIGGGAILPGVSGGVLAVAFGVYRPLMELLSHPVQAIRKHWKLFLPVGVGAAIGFVLFSFLAGAFFKSAPATAACVFVGLIAGTLPGLYRNAVEPPAAKVTESAPAAPHTSDRNPAPAADSHAAMTAPKVDVSASRAAFRKQVIGGWIAGAAAFLVLSGMLLTLKILPGAAAEIVPNLWWYLFCGAVWGLSLIVPGLSSSSILIFLGLYQSMTEGISQLDFSVILPVAAGIVGMAIALGKTIDALFRRYYRVCSFAVMGLVVASTLAIIPLRYTSVWQGLLCAALAVAGFFAALLLDKLSGKFDKAAA